jgi:hypothetical protein
MAAIEVPKINLMPTVDPYHAAAVERGRAARYAFSKSRASSMRMAAVSARIYPPTCRMGA